MAITSTTSLSQVSPKYNNFHPILSFLSLLFLLEIILAHSLDPSTPLSTTISTQPQKLGSDTVMPTIKPISTQRQILGSDTVTSIATPISIQTLIPGRDTIMPTTKPISTQRQILGSHTATSTTTPISTQTLIPGTDTTTTKKCLHPKRASRGTRLMEFGDEAHEVPSGPNPISN